METKKGILLLALGHPHYMAMAYNLAWSIKFNEPSLSIAIVNDGTQLIDSSLFDHSIIAPEESYNTGTVKEYIKAKTWMYQFSPFQETIFLDVDMIMLPGRKLSPFFDTLKKYNWMIANSGKAEVSIWADITEIKQKYKGQMWNYHSEFVYFKKCDANEKYFNLVREVYETADINATSFGGARMADELAFQIASMIQKRYPSIEDFHPTYWFGNNGKASYLHAYQIIEEFVCYSIGGSYLPPHVATTYNQLAGFYAQKCGLQSFYKAHHKRAFLPARQNI